MAPDDQTFVNPLAQPIKRPSASVPPTPSSTPPTPPPIPPTAPSASPPVLSRPAPTSPSVPTPPPPPQSAPQPPVSGRPQPLPPPPPLTNKLSTTSDGGAVTAPDLPAAFAMPTADEIKQEQQRQRILDKAKVVPPPVLNKPFSRESKPADITPAGPPVPPPPVPEPQKLVAQRPQLQPEKLTSTAPPPPPPPPPSTAAKPDIQLGDQPAKGRRWLWLGLVGGLGLIMGLILLLQSSGVIYAGWLASLVGGLPKNPGQALAVIQNKTVALGAYEYKANVAVSLASSLPDLTADSSTVVPEASGTINGQVGNETIRSDYTFVLGSGYPVSTLNGVAVINQETATVFIDTISLLQPKNNWRRLTRADLSQYTLGLPLLQVDLVSLLKNATGGSFVGKSTINQDQAVLTYSYDLKGVISPTDAAIKEGRLTVWASKRDGRVLIAQVDSLISTAVGDVLLQVQNTYSKYGEATVEGVDTEAIVKDGTVAEIYQALGVIPTEADEPTTEPTTEPTGEPTPTPGNANDAQRTTDLTTIAAVLAEYKTDFGLYPIAREAIKSITSGNVLATHLVPDYLPSLPADPSGGSYYYGYKSDGFTFTLTSILEDGTVEGAKQGNGFYYQELTN